MLTFLALYDSLLFAIEDFIHKVVGGWYAVLDSIKEQIPKFVDIHLDLYVCLLSVEIFEGSEEIRIEISLSAIMQIKEYLLELENDVLLLTRVFGKRGIQHFVSKNANMIKLLEERVGVADGVWIFESYSSF